MVSQLKNSLNRSNGCQCLLLSKFWGRPKWISIEIDSKWESGYSKSSIWQFLNDSVASLELNKSWFSLESTLKSSGIEGTININKISYIYSIYIVKYLLVWSFGWFSIHLQGILSAFRVSLSAINDKGAKGSRELFWAAVELGIEWNSGRKGIFTKICDHILYVWRPIRFEVGSFWSHGVFLLADKISSSKTRNWESCDAFRVLLRTELTFCTTKSVLKTSKEGYLLEGAYLRAPERSLLIEW